MKTITIAGIKHKRKKNVEIMEKGYELQVEIEKLGASEELTNCITLVGDYVNYLSKRL